MSTPGKPDLTRWTLTFESAGKHPAPIECRVRQLLKHALRTLALRCTRVSSPAADHASTGANTLIRKGEP